MDKIEGSEFELKDPITENIILSGYIHKELLDGKIQIHIETPKEVFDGPVDYLNICDERK